MQIDIKGEVLIHLKLVRTKLTKKRGGQQTWNMVIKHLLDSYKDVKVLESKVVSKEMKIDNMHEKTEEYLVLSLQRPSSPSMALLQNNQPMMVPPALSPPPPPPLQILDIKPSEDLKNDFITELNMVCGNGVVRKPSEIMGQISPDYDDDSETLEEHADRMSTRKADPKKAVTERIPEKE